MERAGILVDRGGITTMVNPPVQLPVHSVAAAHPDSLLETLPLTEHPTIPPDLKTR